MNSNPLADRIRPRALKDFVGQRHLVGKDKPIYLAIKRGQIHSMIFWGPPGSGKTTLARVISNEIGGEFFHLSAVSAGKEDIQKIIKAPPQAALLPLNPSSDDETSSGKKVLFLDEIHRFNKAQQDFLLPFVENGTITLIGATTENPSFEVISPLLSRCQIFVLEPHSEEELKEILRRGLETLAEEGELKSPTIDKTSEDFLIEFSNGDGRQALNLLEATVHLYGKITPENLKNALQSKFLRYDQLGEEHYDTISAFIKSLRASDVDAALYYLARMVNAGEDPLFIARRMVIFASEDIGMSQPTALVVANEVFRACETIGYPECAINLAQGTVYLATAKKDRSAYNAYFAALGDVEKHGNLPIPLKIRNAPTKLMKDLGYGKGYEKYTKESLLPEKLKEKKYYPTRQVQNLGASEIKKPSVSRDGKIT